MKKLMSTKGVNFGNIDDSDYCKRCRLTKDNEDSDDCKRCRLTKNTEDSVNWKKCRLAEKALKILITAKRAD